MNENRRNHKGDIAQDHILVQHEHSSRWKRVHHTWWFWVGMILIFMAIMYYVVSVDFAFAPRKQLKQQTETNTTP